jgi:hypothetical protein
MTTVTPNTYNFSKDDGYFIDPARDILINPGACVRRAEAPAATVPGRAVPQALFGPNRFTCLEQATLFVAAVPLTQSTPHDVLAGTSVYTRQTFDLGLTGASTATNDSYAAPGQWQSAYASVPNFALRPCFDCTAVTQCPMDVKVTMVLKRDLFGVSQSLIRQVGWVQFGPALLASCMSLAAVFLMLYTVVGDTAHTRSQFIAWSRAVSTAAKAEPGSPAAGDKFLAFTALTHSNNSGGDGAGSFTVYGSPDEPGAAVVCVATREHDIVEVVLTLTLDRTVRVRHGLAGTGPPGKGGGAAAAEYKSMLQAIKTLSVGGVPGAKAVSLTKLVPSASQSRRVTASSVSGSSGVRPFENPAFSPDASDAPSYLGIEPLHEPLLPGGGIN